MSRSASIRRWKRPPFIQNPTLRWGLWVGAAIYLALAFGTMEINWDRVAEGAVRGERFLAAFFPPDFVTRWDSIQRPGVSCQEMMPLIKVASVGRTSMGEYR